MLFRVGLPLMLLWTGRQVAPNSMALVQSFMCCLQDSPCATPREASLQDHMFEGFTYCSESFLAAAAAAGDAQLPAAAGEQAHPAGRAVPAAAMKSIKE